MRKSRLEWTVQRRLIEHFESGSTARTVASLVGVNKSSAAFYFQRQREIIAQESEDAPPIFGEIEVDKSYFEGHRKGKRGCGATGKVLVFGLIKCGGKGLGQGHPGRQGQDPKSHYRR
ncbi:transposase-like protein [Granulicella arctica]|uniref:Transposase-like protein n=1 Tax=Granulicella arctica TaxID=940613 RepID=A0A7Y9PIN0_9BACT|nr:transposase-like protein [Granulicella arctica]